LYFNHTARNLQNGKTYVRLMGMLYTQIHALFKLKDKMNHCTWIKLQETYKMVKRISFQHDQQLAARLTKQVCSMIRMMKPMHLQVLQQSTVSSTLIRRFQMKVVQLLAT